jgi:tRNA C32,U32 (ribose-2'-O)-methylase TrmJ
MAYAGVSEEAVEAADMCAVIPMDGFMESFNISVAAALVMYEARSSRLRMLGAHGDLSPEEQRILKAIMLLRHQVCSSFSRMLAQPCSPPDSAPYLGCHGCVGP